LRNKIVVRIRHDVEIAEGEVLESVLLKIANTILIVILEERRMSLEEQTMDIQEIVGGACRNELQHGFEQNIPKIIEGVTASIKHELQTLPRGETVRFIKHPEGSCSLCRRALVQSR
jgi:hypothetical protein